VLAVFLVVVVEAGLVFMDFGLEVGAVGETVGMVVLESASAGDGDGVITVHPFIRMKGRIRGEVLAGKCRRDKSHADILSPRSARRRVSRTVLISTFYPSVRTLEFCMSITRTVLSTCALLASIAGLAFTAAPAANDTFGGDAYPLETCPVSGEKLGKDAVTAVLSGMTDKKLDGTQMKFCCAKCEASFKADPSKFMPKVEEEIAKAAAPYALGTCLVMSDEGVDADAKTVVYHNRVYKLCCKKCVSRFNADPSKYEKAYEAAIVAKQKATYKATKCPISGADITPDSTDVVVGGRLVRTCCPKCAVKVKADPKTSVAKVDALAAAGGGKSDTN
jgi:hypothetical protein